MLVSVVADEPELSKTWMLSWTLFPIPFRVKGFCGGKVLSGTVF